MLRRRFSWKTDDAEEEVPRKIGDAEEEVDFSFARKINDLKPIIPLSSFLASLNLLRPKTLQASQGCKPLKRIHLKPETRLVPCQTSKLG
jgi:hypothetical protein